MSRDSGGRTWTPQQLEAITTTGQSLLVSAAAGSGKTAVLAERCVHLVCDAKPRCNLNQLLVVTFTEAAAAEMKSRIELALRRRLADAGDDEHLRRQFALIEHASISTLHGFCSRLIRQHFHRLGLDPGFRVLDEDEATLIRLDVVRQLFTDHHDRPDSDAFHRFIDAFGEGDDRRLMDLVISMHHLLGSLIDPEAWMRRAEQRIAQAAAGPLENSELGQEYLQGVEQMLADLDRDCQSAIAAIARMKGFEPYGAYLRYLLGIVHDWTSALAERGYDALVGAVRTTTLQRLPSIPSSTPGKEAASAVVAAIQEQLKAGPLVGNVQFSSQQWEEGLRSILPHTRVLLGLAGEFGARYRKEKDAARAVDFADLERYALQLLREDNSGSRASVKELPSLFSGEREGAVRPSPVAKLMHKQFQHVLVDEYQDINEVQDTILALVSRECLGRSLTYTPNLFCVGDVKQSIYGFRLAEPSRFLDRAAAFRSDPGRGRVVDLQANFRSRKGLLDVLNRVFERLMVAAAVDIEYDESQRLHARAEFPPSPDGHSFRGNPLELHLLPDKLADAADDGSADGASTEADLERSQREALAVAHRIRDLMGQGQHPRMQVADRSSDGTPTTRPIEYRDIVILLRATRYHADEYADVLRRCGIPVYTSGGGGYFESMEVRDILSLLRLLDNQQQDIPLAAVLRSPLSGLPDPEDCLARIRLAYPADATLLPFHEAVERYANEHDDELAAKLRDFLADVREWRQIARQRPVAEVIWAIYERTGFMAFCNGLENGQQRCANLIALYERARQFGTFSRQGLYRFIQFLEELKEETDAPQASELSEAENVVRIMSVHKSKGLEFPVVIAPEMGKRINLQGCSGSILADRRAYLGMTAVDERKRIRYPSLASMLVSQRLQRQMLAEELRVLYVAMTRAREHLILFGTCREASVEMWNSRWALHQGPLPANAILAARNMLDWLGPVAAALADPESIQVFPHSTEEIQAWAEIIGQRQRSAELSARLTRLEPLKPEPPQHPIASAVIERMQSCYPHRAFCSLEASRPITQWTGKAHGPAAPSPSSPPQGTTLPEPRCLLEDATLSAADRGTAVHLFLEHLDYTRPCTDADLAGQVERLLELRIMSPAQAQAVDLQMVRWFLDSPVGRLASKDAKLLRRELSLNYAIEPEQVIGVASDAPLDQMMVRGRIDLLIPDERGFILVDYKTDRVHSGQIAQRVELYRGQMDLYRRAIEKITGRLVHTIHLVFLSAGQIATLSFPMTGGRADRTP